MIRQGLDSGRTQRSLAVEFSVSVMTISGIHRGTGWREPPPEKIRPIIGIMLTPPISRADALALKDYSRGQWRHLALAFRRELDRLEVKP